MAPASVAHNRRGQYIVAGLAALLLWGFGFVADEVIEGDTTAFDEAVTGFFRQDGNPDDPWGPMWLEEAVRDVTALGSFTILGFILLAGVIYLTFSGRGRTAAFIAVSVVGGTVISTGFKMLFDRPRPDVEAATRVFTASFPSGHATVSAVVFLTLGLLLAEATTNRRLKVYFIALGVLLTLAVGVSRIYLGVHYPTDVVAGWSLGAAWALICWVGYSVAFGHDRAGNPANGPSA